MVTLLLFLLPLGFYRYHNEDTHDGAVLTHHTEGRWLGSPGIDDDECVSSSFSILKVF